MYLYCKCLDCFLCRHYYVQQQQQLKTQVILTFLFAANLFYLLQIVAHRILTLFDLLQIIAHLYHYILQVPFIFLNLFYAIKSIILITRWLGPIPRSDSWSAYGAYSTLYSFLLFRPIGLVSIKKYIHLVMYRNFIYNNNLRQRWLDWSTTLAN